jgi:hypothetical protein
MTELEQAVILADKVLDKPYIDPDGDICLLARQFLRLIESSRTAVEDQIKYCSNGSQHTTAVKFLASLPYLPSQVDES